MVRILVFLAVVLAAGLGFAWLADHPGSVSISWLGREIDLSFLTFLAAAILLIAILLVLVWILAGIVKAPGRIGRYVSGRGRDKGYRALTGGILAAGAGDAQTARRLIAKSQRYLDPRKEPLLRFLDAQTSMIEGDHARAKRAFETMEADPNTRLLALRGLFLEAERTNDAVAARHYAEQAVRIAPHVSWSGSAVLELKAAEGDYSSALDILKAQRNARLVEKGEAARLRAVLLTGQAQSLLAADPVAARTAASEAEKLAPDLVPATLVAARAAIATGDSRRASRILEKAWMRAPHAAISELYVHARPGEGAADRLGRAKKLQQLQPDSPEGHLAVAHAALAAKAVPLARSEAEAAVRIEPSQSAFLLLADIEEAEGHGEGRIREQMDRAFHAPRDATWIADGTPSAEWAPVSPVTGRLDAYEWKSPTERPAPRKALGTNGAAFHARTGRVPDTADEAAPARLALEGETLPPANRPAVEGEADKEARKDARFNL